MTEPTPPKSIHSLSCTGPLTILLIDLDWIRSAARQWRFFFTWLRDWLNCANRPNKSNSNQNNSFSSTFFCRLYTLLNLISKAALSVISNNTILYREMMFTFTNTWVAYSLLAWPASRGYKLAITIIASIVFTLDLHLTELHVVSTLDLHPMELHIVVKF